MRRSVLRVVTAVAVLGLAVGCGESGGKPPAVAKQAVPSVKPAPKVTEERLSREVLERAALGEGDARGVDILEVPQKEVPSLPANAVPYCGAVGLGLSRNTDPKTKVRVSRGAFDGKRHSALIMSLFAHNGADARAVMKGLRADLADCPGFRGDDGAHRTVSSRAEKLGDEAVSYRVAAEWNKKHPRFDTSVVVVVRTGSVVMIVKGQVMGAGPQAERDVRLSAHALVEAQLGKLARTS
ncbi:hypothetical protein ACFRLW_00935 [Streptomyces sp. NPDC056728]